MYYYYVDGTITRKQLVESTDEDGAVVYSTTEVSEPIKKAVSESDMIGLFKSGTTVYISHDDEANNTAEDTMITQSYIDGLGTIVSTTSEEEVVGSDGTTTQNVTRYRVDKTTKRTVLNQTEFTSVDVTIDSIAGNASFITTITPQKTDYKLVGVVGWTIAGVSTIVPFRLYVGPQSRILYIGLRNTTSTAVTDKTLTVYLMWQLDIVELEDLGDEEEEQLVGNDAPQDLEEVEDM